jgi:rhamnosyltransferase
MSEKSISVIIPVKNEALKIRKCIEGILSQTVQVLEIIILDSGSTDGTIEIAEEYPLVKMIHIPAGEFNHGETRNAGIRQARGDYVLLTVGDAVSVNNQWIEHLLSGFDDEKVACVYGQQIVPHELDKNPMEWFFPVSKPKMEKFFAGSVNKFKALSPIEKLRHCSIDDVTAMYRKDLHQLFPFKKVTYSEDVIWGRDAQMNGYSLVFNPFAKVYHYHKTNPAFDFKRTFIVHFFNYTTFNLIPELKRDPFFFLRVLKKMLKMKEISFSQKYKWFIYNLKQRNAIQKASSMFIDIVKNKPDKLDFFYKKYAGSPPIPLKGEKANT